MLNIRINFRPRRPYRALRFSRKDLFDEGPCLREVIEVSDGSTWHQIWFTSRIRRAIFARHGNGAPIDLGGPLMTPLQVHNHLEHQYYQNYLEMFKKLMYGWEITVPDDATAQQALHDAQNLFYGLCKVIYRSIPPQFRVKLVLDDFRHTTPLYASQPQQPSPLHHVTDVPSDPSDSPTRWRTLGDDFPSAKLVLKPQKVWKTRDRKSAKAQQQNQSKRPHYCRCRSISASSVETSDESYLGRKEKRRLKWMKKFEEKDRLNRNEEEQEKISDEKRSPVRSDGRAACPAIVGHRLDDLVPPGHCRHELGPAEWKESPEMSISDKKRSTALLPVRSDAGATCSAVAGHPIDVSVSPGCCQHESEPSEQQKSPETKISDEMRSLVPSPVHSDAQAACPSTVGHPFDHSVSLGHRRCDLEPLEWRKSPVSDCTDHHAVADEIPVDSWHPNGAGSEKAKGKDIMEGYEWRRRTAITAHDACAPNRAREAPPAESTATPGFSRPQPTAPSLLTAAPIDATPCSYQALSDSQPVLVPQPLSRLPATILPRPLVPPQPDLPQLFPLLPSSFGTDSLVSRLADIIISRLQSDGPLTYTQLWVLGRFQDFADDLNLVWMDFQLMILKMSGIIDSLLHHPEY